MTRLTVRNPVAELATSPTPRAPRARELGSLRLGLWWNKKAGGEVALERLASNLATRFGTTSAPFYGRFPGAPELVKECAGWSDVVIGATADCGSCTSWLIHDLIEIERHGTPAVALVTREFLDDARQTAYVMGMPDIAIVEMPRTLTNFRPDQIEVMADGLVDDVIAALTREERLVGGDAAPLPTATPTSITYDGVGVLEALDAFQHDFTHVRGLGDGFPLVPPTDDKVTAMLAGTRLAPDDQVAVLPPAFGLATVEAVAINAVMAGCRPEHLPVLLAATAAFADPLFSPRAVAMSTGAHAPFLVVNGPIAPAIGMNSGRAALGPGRASAVNTAIGRAFRLVMMNVGYAYVGIFDLDTIGTPRKYSMCVAENEGASPWGPQSVERGVPDGESAVTLFSVETAAEVQDLASTEPERLLRTFAHTAFMAGAASVQHTYLETQGPGMHNLLLLAPDHAAVLGDAGWDRDRIRSFMFEHTKRPKHLVLNAVNENTMRPEAAWVIDLAPDDLIPIVRDVDFFDVAVVGGAGGKSQYLTGIGFPVTRSIEPYRA